MERTIWERIASGRERLHDLKVGTIDGRLDLRNLHVPEPHMAATKRTSLANITALEGISTIRGQKWRSLDFSSSELPSLRLIDCDISDCVFDDCRLHDLRIWGSKFGNVSFRSTHLHGAVLGGVIDGKRNIFKDVDFTSADLRKTVYQAAEFNGCHFINTRLDGVDFQSSCFSNCVFEGELKGVIFHRRGFRGEGFPENNMIGVDFSNARLRWTEFRGLDLDNVSFPKDDEHLVIYNFPHKMEILLNFIKRKSDVGSKRLVAALEHTKKWLGNNQKIGVLNKLDILEMADDEGLKSVLSILGAVDTPREPRTPD